MKQWVFGSIPYSNFKERNRIVNRLRTEIGKKVRISIETDMITYEYYNFQQ